MDPKHSVIKGLPCNQFLSEQHTLSTDLVCFPFISVLKGSQSSHMNSIFGSRVTVTTSVNSDLRMDINGPGSSERKCLFSQCKNYVDGSPGH